VVSFDYDCFIRLRQYCLTESDLDHDVVDDREVGTVRRAKGYLFVCACFVTDVLEQPVPVEKWVSIAVPKMQYVSQSQVADRVWH
jgi:hypothetical protein